MLINDYFTKDEIIKTMENAEEYDEPDFECLFDDMVKNCDYIIGTYEAAQALGTFKNDEKLDGYTTDLDGVFGAIELVKQYEFDQFGVVSTPLDDPEKLANMVEYIRRETLFNEALSKANLTIVSDVTKQSIKKFIEATKKL
jgi:hypothetical protein